eukprot:XP_017945031.1 PREDICTED: rho GTPase-activating protein 42-like isoform X2 [Xenopus tropicalis]
MLVPKRRFLQQQPIQHPHRKHRIPVFPFVRAKQHNKSVSLPQRDKKGVGIPWVTSAPSSNGQKGSSFWTTSPESSSKDDTTKTDVESDCQSVSSITSPGNASPPIDLTKKSLYGLSGLKRSQAPSLRSLSSTEAIGIKSRSPSTQSLTSLDLQDVPKVHPELSPKIMRR